MRLFFGIFVDEVARPALVDLDGRARRACPGRTIRWTKPEQLHVTLQFLGDLEEARAEEAARIAHAIAPSHRPFAIDLGGLGAFPSAKRPSVLWVGVRAGAEPLTALADDLGRALSGAGFAIDARRFHPHVTLARVHDARGGRAVSELLARGLEDDGAGTSRVDRFLLVESRLGPGGSVYAPIEAIALSAS